MENETPSRPGWTGRHTHSHTYTPTPTTDPLQTIRYVQYHQPVSTDSSNNSPNVRSINVNKMDATAYPEARPICWIESDRMREREGEEWDKNSNGAEKPFSNRNCIAKIVTKLCRWFMLLLLLFALCGPLFLRCVCFFFFFPHIDFPKWRRVKIKFPFRVPALVRHKVLLDVISDASFPLALRIPHTIRPDAARNWIEARCVNQRLNKI